MHTTEKPPVYAPSKVEITRISVPLTELFVFMLKLTIASIPAIFIATIFVAMATMVVAAIWGIGLSSMMRP